uniref:hypothetical protein n=1 Tax=Gemmiger formicilis TaxID=745368 RepID=UPI003FF0A520
RLFRMSILLGKNIYLIESSFFSSSGIIKSEAHKLSPPAGAALADCYLTAAAYLPCEISNRL